MTIRSDCPGGPELGSDVRDVDLTLFLRGERVGLGITYHGDESISLITEQDAWYILNLSGYYTGDNESYTCQVWTETDRFLEDE